MRLTRQGRRHRFSRERKLKRDIPDEMKETLRWYREWIYGLLSSIGRMAIGKRPAMRGIVEKCPYCKKVLKIEARVCAFCGAIL